ncbi:phosphoglycerate mutase [Phellopilus nigrolimitatus]|nr:phosphoglycerate mutase [Phellopilus nigrolimitatus]
MRCGTIEKLSISAFLTVRLPFLQDSVRFGLLDASSDRWHKLLSKLETLNKESQKGITYKLIIAGRHGQGFHNLAELKYGVKDWNEYWAKLDGDGKIVWGPDPLLTSLGEDQARDANALWKEELKADIPLPAKLYCSPLTRALRTCQLTFAGIVEFRQRTPLVLENCREMYGVHSCDKRRSLSYLRSAFPDFAVEDGFTEEDELHDPKVREEHAHIAERARLVLDYIFEEDEELVISITAHSGFINGLIAATGHELVALLTGGAPLAFLSPRVIASVPFH